MHPCSERSARPDLQDAGDCGEGMESFRHCSATLMDPAGVPMKVRQERLGHAPGTPETMVRYAHTVSDDARLAARAVGSLLVN